MSSGKIVLVNAPVVRHAETGFFLGLDPFISFERLRAKRGSRYWGKPFARVMHALYKRSAWVRKKFPPEYADFWIAKEHFFSCSTAVNAGVRAGSRWPHMMDGIFNNYTPFPFIMAYASSLLKREGFDAEIMDCVAARQYSYTRFLDDLRAKQPDIVIVETSTPTLDIDLWVCEQVSRFAEVALAGPHLTDLTTAPLAEAHPEIRYFLKGEYINSALEMARTRRPGIYEIDVAALDDLPFPDRSFRGALDTLGVYYPHVHGPQLQMWGSKGCPFHCKFCLWPQTMYKGNVSLRSPVNIAQEIREAVSKQRYIYIYFDDDTFNIGDERIAELCDYLKAIGLPWGIMARLDTSPLWLFKKMVASGCIGMKFGVESFDPAVLKRINKGLEREEILATISELCKLYPHVQFHLTMQRGLPGQSDEVHQKDMRLLEQMGFLAKNPYRTYQLSTCIPFVGTELWKELEEEKNHAAC